jgi:hypothetical protein
MESFKIQTHVGHDGVLRLEVPTKYADTQLDIEVNVVQSHAEPHRSWPQNFFTEVIGSWEGDFPSREQGEYEVREDWA